MSQALDTGFVWPPRAENVILPGLLTFYEQRHWFAQIKKNGACSEIIIDANGELKMLQRTGQPFAAYQPPASLVAQFAGIPGTGHVFLGELLHQKTPHIKHTVYLYDILVWRGESLVGTTYRTRWNLLSFCLDWHDVAPSHLAAGPGLWLAKNCEIGFAQMFAGLTAPEDEGLVLRDPDAKLAPCLNAAANTNWMVKARKGTKNYGF